MAQKGNSNPHWDKQQCKEPAEKPTVKVEKEDEFSIDRMVSARQVRHQTVVAGCSGNMMMSSAMSEHSPWDS